MYKDPVLKSKSIISRLTDEGNFRPDVYMNPSEAGFVFHAVIDVQEEQWAQKIIISGGESMADIIDNSASLANNTMDENVDLFPMIKIFNDNEVMKLVAKNVQPPF